MEITIKILTNSPPSRNNSDRFQIQLGVEVRWNSNLNQFKKTPALLTKGRLESEDQPRSDAEPRNCRNVGHPGGLHEWADRYCNRSKQLRGLGQLQPVEFSQTNTHTQLRAITTLPSAVTCSQPPPPPPNFEDISIKIDLVENRCDSDVNNKFRLTKWQWREI